MTITELVERLREATAPSRELDAEIAVSVAGMTRRNRLAEWPGIDPQWEFTDGRTSGSMSAMVPAYTASVDAAILLAERVLPGASVLMGWNQTETTRPWARVGTWSAPDATGATPAIALCIAVLFSLTPAKQAEGLTQ